MNRLRAAALAGLLVATHWIAGTARAQEFDPRLKQAIAFYTGTGGTVDDARAHDLLVQALQTPEPITRMWLARVYSRGRMEFERDEAQARVIAGEVIGRVRELAEDGVAEAVFLMGTAYDEGLGVDADAATAVSWYHRAADLDNVLAQHNLGNVYSEGRGVPRSDSHALYWWRRAADQGDAIPQWQVGRVYEQGIGVQADRDEALRWYREAAGRGNRQAREALQRLGER